MFTRRVTDVQSCTLAERFRMNIHGKNSYSIDVFGRVRGFERIEVNVNETAPGNSPLEITRNQLLKGQRRVQTKG